MSLIIVLIINSILLWIHFSYGDLVPSKAPIGRLLATVSMFLGILWKVLLFSSITVTCLVYLENSNRALTLAGKRVRAQNPIKEFDYSPQSSGPVCL